MRLAEKTEVTSTVLTCFISLRQRIRYVCSKRAVAAQEPKALNPGRKHTQAFEFHGKEGFG